MSTHSSALPHTAVSTPELVGPSATCLNCGAPLGGSYCSACGQQAVDLAAPTWHVVRQALEDATDVNGRVLHTASALVSPGRLTTEFLRGRRMPYLGPLKLFLLAGTVLTTTWIVTRGVDSHYYGIAADQSAGSYIDKVVRGFLAASIAIAGCGWLLGRGRRRLLDEAVFALHLVAALAFVVSAVIWVGTTWKLVWGTEAAVPRSVPSLIYLLFLPATIVALGYVVTAVHRVHRGRWLATALRALVTTGVGIAAVIGVISF
jgi:hypothetical protein